MEAISSWLSYEPQKIEKQLSEQENLKKIVSVFSDHTSVPSFPKILQPFLSICSASVLLNKLLASPSFGLIPQVLELLETTSDTFSKVRLLKILNSFFVNCDNKKQMITSYNLNAAIKKIAETDDRVIVAQMTDLLLQNFSQHV
jgi:hypothetical protein